jgi:endonuclease YncB( thermonuclease family)
VAETVIAVLITLAATALATTRRLGYVVDGDTVRLRSGAYVRFIGLDAPEPDACGGAASERVMNRLVEGTIRLKRPLGYDNRDYFKRLLRYVHDRSRDTGRALIRRGYARNYDAFPHPRQARYERAERRARRANRRLWRTCWRGSSPSHDESSSLGWGRYRSRSEALEDTPVVRASDRPRGLLEPETHPPAPSLPGSGA